ncbi:MAG: hypothetical protein SFY80_04040 [Verrucomicrobiota bacterium]|nr:hypothetical protein [Verrucomicrobiota bacterium]
MNSTEHHELIILLVRYLAAGKLQADEVMPLMRQLLAEQQKEPLSRADLIVLLSSRQDIPGAMELAMQLQRTQLASAHRCFMHRRDRKLTTIDRAAFPDFSHLPAQVPLGWQNNQPTVAELEHVMKVVEAWCLVQGKEETLPQLCAEVGKQFNLLLENIRGNRSKWKLLELEATSGQSPEVLEKLQFQRKAWLDAARRVCVSSDPVAVESVDADCFCEVVCTEFAAAAGDRTRQEQLLDRALTFPTDRVAPLIPTLCHDEWAKDRAAQLLMLRFGIREYTNWDNWSFWLVNHRDISSQKQSQLQAVKASHPRTVELLGHLLLESSGAVIAGLVSEVKESARKNNPEALIDYWRQYLSQREVNQLRGVPMPPPLPQTVPVALPPPLPKAEGRGQKAEVEPVPPLLPSRNSPVSLLSHKVTVPPVETAWQKHVQPFITENWYIFAGLLMVVIGASLLAYFTWDKHWLVRYTIMPVLLALLTCGLARTGTWLEARSPTLKGTGAMLRAAAIGLLPINFMVLALMGNDDSVSAKALVVPLMSVGYAGFFGWQLRRWCRAVHEGLGLMLGGTLLLLNSLVVLGPLTHSLSGPESLSTGPILAIGFHLGFAAVALACWCFSRQIMTTEMITNRRVLWFFLGTLAMTFVQVFVLLHWSMKHLPPASTYALMVLLTGGLILFLERCYIDINTNTSSPREESFLGFACLLLGLLMAWASPPLRIIALLLAGSIWLYQAGQRRGVIHQWIGLTLLMLGVAATGLLDGFPKSQTLNLLPALGLAAGLGFGVMRRVARQRSMETLAGVLVDFQAVVLVITAVVALLSQWHYRSEPLHTALYLMAIAAFFGWRAAGEKRLGWVHTTMMLLALALPYLGCVDMNGRSLHGNTLVFGLAVLSSLWLLLIRMRPAPLLIEARSTVLWVYGAIAVAAMVIRVVIEQNMPGDILWYRVAMDITGPILMTLVLAITAWHSRSLVPSVMAAFILAVLFPEIKAQFTQWFPYLRWGSGLGGMLCATAITLFTFYLKQWPCWKQLAPGDRFLGRTPFPFLRMDATLFTLPLLGTALFQVIRMDTWTLVRLLDSNTLGRNSYIALALSSLVWTLLAVHCRASRWANVMVHLGWIMFFITAVLLTDLWIPRPNVQVPFLATGLLLQLLLPFYWWQAKRHEWITNLLVKPTLFVLRYASLLICWMLTLYLVDRGQPAHVSYLGVFVLCQCLWHGWVKQGKVYGTSVLLLTVTALLALSTPGTLSLLKRLTIESSLTPILLLVLVIQVVQIALERTPSLHQRMRWLTVPFQAGSVLLVLLCSLEASLHLQLSWNYALTIPQMLLLLVALLLTARAQRSGLLSVIAALLTYQFAHIAELGNLVNPADRIHLSMEPLLLAVLGFVLAALSLLGRRLHTRYSLMLAGPYPLWMQRIPASFWFLLAATLAVILAVINHALLAEYRLLPLQMITPFLCAVTLGLLAYLWRLEVYGIGAALVLALGNCLAVNLLGSGLAEQYGMSVPHLISIGVIISLIEGRLAAWLTPVALVKQRIGQGSVIAAGLILLLLAFNYFTHPNLSTITSARFVVSGLLAVGAAQYFRRAAKFPETGQESLVNLFEGLHHLGITLALWCGMLVIPALRQPYTALIAMGAPALYFYLRAELGLRGDEARQLNAQRYITPATILGFIILALYSLRIVFQMVLFPGTALDLAHYHYNAPVILVLAVFFFRMHGLGGTAWLSFYGGLALMTGSFFAVTSWPGLSPFLHPLPAAWVAVTLAHLFILASHQHSPVRSVVHQISGITDEDWSGMRRWWGRWLLAGTQIVVAVGLSHYESDTYQVALLLAASASVFIHQGIAGSIKWYHAVAALLLLVALHADFMVPSYLDRSVIIWVLLGVWGAALLGFCVLKDRVNAAQMGIMAALLFMLGMTHVVYHHPSSVVGLSAVALMAVLGAFTPRETRHPATGEQIIAAALFIFVIPWLVYFSQVEVQLLGVEAAFAPWPILTTLVALVAVGGTARWCQINCAGRMNQWAIEQPRQYHHIFSLLGTHGIRIQQAILGVAFTATLALIGVNYEAGFANRELALVCLLCGLLAAGWYRISRELPHAIWPSILAELAVVALFIALRRHLILTTPFWSYEYDVWTSLAVSCGLTGAKRLIDKQPRGTNRTLLGTLFILPVLAIVWTLFHGLGTDLALLVVGVNSLMFLFLGRDERQSPYTVVAIAGFVAFVLLLFWSKLELRVLHAYTLPVGVGILTLLHGFGGDMNHDTRNRIRLITVLAMLSSSGYYALLDGRYPLVFNLTLLILCLLAMGMGSLLRVQIYLMVGFGGLLVTLAAIVYKVVVRLDGTFRMTTIGVLILLLGIGVVAGSIYYKSNRGAFEEKLKRLRERLGEWE